MQNIFKKQNKFLRTAVIGLFSFVLLFGLFFAYNSKASNNVTQVQDGFSLEQTTVTKDFKMSELPQIDFQFKKQRGFWAGLGAGIKGVFVDEYKGVKIDSQLTARDQKLAEVPNLEIKYLKNGKFRASFKEKPRQFKPGQYSLEFAIKETSGKTVNFTQDFNWGVLAMNFNKSIYKAGDNAYIQMAVLNQNGHTICDADLSLAISAPGLFGGTDNLSTKGNTIVRNPACGPDNVIDTPDYYLNYKVLKNGVYNLKLTATTKNGVYEIADSFEVKDGTVFDVERTGPTRIYPKANYPLMMGVVANEDFAGDVIETVPKDFLITSYELKITNNGVIRKINNKLEQVTLGDSKALIWKNVGLKKGETLNISYIFDAPDISPEFYLLGPLQLQNDKQKLTVENRQWQIASDAVATHYIARRTSQQITTGTAGWFAVTGTANAGTTASANGWLGASNFTVGRKYLLSVWGYHDVSNTAAQSGLRVVHGATPTAFAESQTIEKADQTAYKTPYHWFTVWTATNENVDVQMYLSTANRTTRVDDITLTAIDVTDLITSGDLIWNVATTTATNLTTTPTSKSNISWRPKMNNDNWWIDSYFQGTVNTALAPNILARLNLDAGTYISSALIGGKINGDTPLYGLGWTGAFSNTATHTVAMELSQSAANYQWAAAGTMALNLSAFQDSAIYASTTSVDIPTNAVYYKLTSLTPTPKKVGDWLSIAGFVAKDNSAIVTALMRESAVGITTEYGGYQQNTTGADYVPYTAADIASFSTTTKLIETYTQSHTATTPASSTYPWSAAFSLELKSPPTAYFNYATAATNSSGVVGLSMEVNDVDWEDTRVKMEYATGTSCNFAGSGDPTFSITNASTTADIGDPLIDNNYPYQIGTTSAMITTASTSNTVNFSWNSATDLPTANGVTYCLQITADDVRKTQVTPATTTVLIDNVKPVLAAVAIPDLLYKVGDVMMATITVSSDVDTYTLDAASTINGVTPTNFTKVNDTTYTLKYTVVEGDGDHLATGTIPYSLILADRYNNKNTVYAGNFTNGSLDAHVPVISAITTPDLMYGIGSTLRATITVSADAEVFGLGAATINGKTAMNLQKINNTTYTVDYVVAEGDTNRASGTIPISMIVGDPHGNLSTAWTTLTSNASLDAVRPVISAVFIPNTAYGIGSNIILSVISDQQNYILGNTQVNTVTINPANLTDNHDNTYSLSYVVQENDPDRLSGTIPISIILTDAYGNTSLAKATTSANTASIDAHRPEILTISIPNVAYKIGDTVRATTTVTAPTFTDTYTLGTTTINGIAATNLQKINNSTYTFDYVVQAGNTDRSAGTIPISLMLVDGIGQYNNPASTTVIVNTASIDAHAPGITNVTFAPISGVLKIGDMATATITALGNETGLSANNFTINGIGVTGTFAEIGGGQYRVTYVVAEGNTDKLDSDNLPVDFTLRDTAGNISANYTTADAANRPGVDANKPVISSVVFAPTSGVLKIGSIATATITMANSETGLSSSTLTINGVNVSNTFVELGGGQYRVTYTVVEGNTDRSDSADLPISFTVKDQAGNISNAFATADINNRPGVDANKPVISGVIFTPSSGVLKVGDIATATISTVGNETGMLVGNTMTINGISVIGTFTEIGGGQYRVVYTVQEGQTDRADAADLPIDFTIKDPAGNQSLDYTTADASNRPGVDAHTPGISNVIFTPTSSLLKIGDTATATITALNNETGLLANDLTINNKNVISSFTEIGGGQYRITYTVVEGDIDRNDIADLPVSFRIIDTAGNISTNYTTADATNRPGVDANKPVISSVVFTPTSGVLKIGSIATATITMANSETGLSSSTLMINGVNVSSTFTELGAGQYRVIYTVAEGNTDRLDSVDLPISFTVKDPAGNISNAFTSADINNRPGIDANKPVISGIIFTPSSGVLKVGDIATATISTVGNETGMLVGSTMTINGISVVGTFAEIGGGQYRVVYTVQEGQTDRTDAADLPIDFTIKDPAGNQSLDYTTADASNRPGVDAHTPTAPGNLSFVRNANNSVTLLFGTTTTESNFAEYKIFYKIGASGVTEGDSAWTAVNDGNLNNINFGGATTTTVTSLSIDTTYVFNIWAYDQAGNKSYASGELSASTNHTPNNITAVDQLKANNSTSIANQAWTEENQVNLKASIRDNDTAEILTLYWQVLDNGGTFATATNTPAGACNSGTAFGSCASKIWAATSSAGDYSATPYQSTVNVTGLTETAAGYKWQVLACDDTGACSAWAKFNNNAPNFYVDLTAPTTPGNLIFNARTSTSITLNWGATTSDLSFKEYRIYYKKASSGVTENDSLFGTARDANLGYIDFNGASVVTIDNLTASSTYVFNIWAYDQAGHKTNAIEVSDHTDRTFNPPVALFNSVAEKTDGSGAVDISVNINDPENDPVRLQLEFSTSSVCDFSTSLDPTFDENLDNISADVDSVIIDNNSQYQVGTSTGWITITYTGNNVNFDWFSKTDLPNQSGLYCVRVKANDSFSDQLNWATTTVYIDNVNPTAPGQLTLNRQGTYDLDLNFGASSTEDNFNYYKIYYKQGASGVTEGDTPLVDVNLNNQNYNNKATTSVGGLAAGTNYVFNIWAYDLYGNESSATEASFGTNHLPQNPTTLSQLKNDGTTDIINNGWTNESILKLKASALDVDTSEVLTVYYQFIDNSGNLTIDASEPGSACVSGTDFGACASKFWKATSTANDYSVTPFVGASTIIGIPDSTTGYKWQALACDDNHVCSAWTEMNFVKPNVKIDTVMPTTPGNLSLSARTYNSIVLNFGTSTTESSFQDYKIYYKQGASSVSEANTLFTDANMAFQNYNSATTTTISGLLENTQYVFNIWAYDLATNKNKATEVTYYTNNRPTGSFGAINFRTNGSGVADIAIQVNDTNNDNAQAKVEYVAGADCNFATPLKPSFDQTDENATSTQGDAKILNSNTYQIGNAGGWILTSGANTVNFDWLSQLNLNNQEGIYCLRLTANDQMDDQATLATTTVYIDNLPPTQPGSLALNKTTANSITLNFGTTTTETNFTRYKIFYREGAGSVVETDSEKTDSNLADINFNGATTTIISGLTNNTQYSFKIWAYDAYGNKTASDQATFTTNAPPISSFNSVAEKTNGSGVIDISANVYDVNGDACTAKLEYVAGGACNFGTPLDPTLDETQANISSTYGVVGISNAQTNQIGTSTGKIVTNSGANTINFDWQSKTDIPNANGVYCLRLTASDDSDNQLILATTTVLIDNTPPSRPGVLTSPLQTGVSITVAFGATSTDTNFSDYKIYYKQGVSGVTENDTEFSSYDDLNLGNVNFNGASTTDFLKLHGNIDYVFNIYAYDLYGNRSSSTAELSTSTLSILSATWRESEDVPDPVAGNYLGRHENVRVRLALANSGEWMADNYQYHIEYGVKNGTCQNANSWITVPVDASSEEFRIMSSDYFDNGTTTTNRLSNDAYSFIPGQMIESPSTTTQSITLASGQKTEIEYVFEATDNSRSGKTYCFRAVDAGGVLDTYGVYPELTLAPPPTATFNSALQKSDASQVVDVSVNVNDLGKELNVAKVEYVEGATCDFTSPTKATIDSASDKLSADFGNVQVDNNYPYQIGTSTNKIITRYGVNKIDFDWRADQDLIGKDTTYCLRVTANDGFEDQTTPATTTVVIDQVSPSVPGDLSYYKKTSDSVTLKVSTSTDTNFGEYRIYYKEGSSGVTESDMMWASSSDPNFGHQDFNGATTTKITGLETNKQYVFKIWAYDKFGNRTSSIGEEVVIIRYSSKGENWRWYSDQFNETPTSTMASEGVTPSDMVSGAAAKLRIALHEQEGITGTNIKMRLQYSTYSDFSADVNFVGEIGSSTAIWTYGNGVDNDGALVSTPVLAGVSLGATHNESGISTSTYIHLANEKVEFEFTVKDNDAPMSTTYYFRIYDVQGNAPVNNNDGYTYPSIVTSAGMMTYSVLNFNAGSSTEGVVANVNSTANSMNFGEVFSGEEAIGVHRFNITTNAGGGYQLFAYQRQNLISNKGISIDPFSATNESPMGWSVAPDSSAFGYHTSDDTLSGISPSRFAPNNTYARFETNMKEVSFSQIPTTNEAVDLIYRLDVSGMQAAGDYETEMVYILVPTFYE